MTSPAVLRASIVSSREHQWGVTRPGMRTTCSHGRTTCQCPQARRQPRSRPGKLNYNAGVGQLPIIFEGFLQRRRLDMVLVSYRESRSAVQDLAEGRLDVLVGVMTGQMPAVHAGRVRYIAITNDARAPLAPEIEAAAEAGYPELTLTGLEGFFGWRDMPAKLRDRISEDIQSVAADRALSDRIAALGYVARGSTPAKYVAALEEQRAKVASILKMTGAKPQ